jgi:DNA-binding CsgD family transcriptional regulator
VKELFDSLPPHRQPTQKHEKTDGHGKETSAGRAHARDAMSSQHQVVSSWSALTDRQLQVLVLVADGLTNAEIASRMFLSHWTVKRHVAILLRKLGLARRVDLAVWYHAQAPLDRVVRSRKGEEGRSP